MPDFLLADDLSGALDAAAAFHRTGRRVTAVLGDLGTDELARGAEIVAFTTETRNDSPVEAAAKVARVLAKIRAAGATVLFKKIDSTMRGPVAAELGALAAALPEARILFCPANPAVGRTVRDGVLYVRGVPVAETEFARDPANPVRESSIRRLLGEAMSERVVVADAETQADLDAAVAKIAAADENWIAVGSSALAASVASRWPVTRRTAAVRRIDFPGPGPMLVLCGSAHSVNRAQAARLARECGTALHELRPGGPAVAEVAASLRTGGEAVLLVETNRGERTAVLGAIANLAAALVERENVRRIFVMGGETAFAVCARLGIGVLEFVEELETGVSVSVAPTARGPILLAMKPGGFGDEATWVRVRERMGPRRAE